MNNYRLYGNVPYQIALVHGGPGAAGEMKPVAMELSKNHGIIEPLQTASSLNDQVNELYLTLKTHADTPVILVGWSWGAMLSYIFTATYPNLVQKLILIGSAAFDEKYAKNIMLTRKNRLSKKELTELNNIVNQLQDDNISLSIKNSLFPELGKIIYNADSYDPYPYQDGILECNYAIYLNVWNDAVKFRKEKRFLEIGKNINCPVIIIHGDYDPHPIEGIKEPLSNILNDIQTIVLPKCGHHPWLERQAKKTFYKILTSYL